MDLLVVRAWEGRISQWVSGWGRLCQVSARRAEIEGVYFRAEMGCRRVRVITCGETTCTGRLAGRSYVFRAERAACVADG